MEWVIGYEGDKQRVLYQFDGTKLERKANSAGKSANISIACKPPENAFQFLVTIEAASVTVTSPSCEKPDTYASPDHDLTKGKIGIKRDSAVCDSLIPLLTARGYIAEGSCMVAPRVSKGT